MLSLEDVLQNRDLAQSQPGLGQNLVNPKLRDNKPRLLLMGQRR